MELKEKLISRSEPRKVVTILRATSNSGKTTYANHIKSLFPETVICCADDFFETKEGYKFNPKQLGLAHQKCKDKFHRAIQYAETNIIVANTNTRESEFHYYRDLAEKFGYKVFFLVLENRHRNVNHHNIPDEVIYRQQENLRNNLKLS